MRSNLYGANIYSSYVWPMIGFVAERLRTPDVEGHLRGLFVLIGVVLVLFVVVVVLVLLLVLAQDLAPNGLFRQPKRSGTTHNRHVPSWTALGQVWLHAHASMQQMLQHISAFLNASISRRVSAHMLLSIEEACMCCTCCPIHRTTNGCAGHARA